MFWLGREYVYHRNFDKGIETLKRHLSLETAQWSEERSASMRFIAQCYEEMGIMKEARSWLFRALAECPDAREPYLALVKSAYKEKNWPLTFAMAEKGLTISRNSGSYLVDPESWGNALYDYGSVSAYNMGMYEKARDYARIALSMNSSNKRLQNNLLLIEDKIKKQEKAEESS